jgi:mono/diheme cytochrome c family protein
VSRSLPLLVRAGAVVAAAGALSALAACKPSAPAGNDAPEATSATASEVPSAAASAAPAKRKRAIAIREGQALVRAPGEAALYVADEDHEVLRRIVLDEALSKPPPLTDPATVAHAGANASALKLPGRPAQALALDGELLVTVRDPGLLLIIRAGEHPEIEAKVELPADAWGIAVSPDLATAYVTSAWTHRLSAVDLAARKVKWSVETAREPRGVVVSADGATVYVSHLIGAPLTVVDVRGEPSATRVPFPADPLRTPYKETTSASLGYAALLSPDGRRLFVARHALGSAGAWQGAPTIDVFSTATNAPIAPQRKAPPLGTLTKEDLEQNNWGTDEAGVRVGRSGTWVVPRAMVYRKKTDHLLVASEALPVLAELDALSIAPGLVTNRYYELGGLAPKEATKIQIAPDCGAPTGVVLSEDEDVAWVYCRTTDNLVAVRLTPNGVRSVRSETEHVEAGNYKQTISLWGPFAYASLVEAEADASEETQALALGRRLFFDATEPAVSGGISCGACHPDGRDDGHVWREVLKYPTDKLFTFISGPSIIEPDVKEGFRYGYARQTPMLAGRVDAAGPYGWHSESPDLVARIKAGFSLHRWWDRPADGLTNRRRAEPLAAYLRKGLVPPPRHQGELTSEEASGKKIFESPQARCSTCHVPKTGYTDRSALPVPLQTPPRFWEEENKLYKVPSLLYVGGTAPYYHDGSFASLEELIDKNLDRMGKTTHLTKDERRDLVAYLRTL